MTTHQLSIPLSGDGDERPVPEIVADAFGFKLAYRDTGNGRRYSVQDWLIGVAKTDNPRRFWTDLNRRVKRIAGNTLYDSCVQLPYKATNSRTYQMDFADAETLYTITQRMDVNTGIRDEVLKYLAKAGVVVDELRARNLKRRFRRKSAASAARNRWNWKNNDFRCQAENKNRTAETRRGEDRFEKTIHLPFFSQQKILCVLCALCGSIAFFFSPNRTLYG